MNVSEINALANEVNQLHAQACSSAAEAVTYAMEAGKLLQTAKASLAHGQFTTWIRNNLRVSVRQAQRYMAVASGKPVSGNIFGISDTMSHLPLPRGESYGNPGISLDNEWVPEPGQLYVIREEVTGTYWVHPAKGGGTHVCRHYVGPRLRSEGFSRRYTILSEVRDPHLTSKYYIGTRFAPLSRRGIHKILVSYGLRDIGGASILGLGEVEGSDRPIGEPDPRYWYWDTPGP